MGKGKKKGFGINDLVIFGGIGFLAFKFLGAKRFADNATFNLEKVQITGVSGTNLLGKLHVVIVNPTPNRIKVTGLNLSIFTAKNDVIANITSPEIISEAQGNSTRIIDFNIPIPSLVSAMLKEGRNIAQNPTFAGVKNAIMNVNFNIKGRFFFGGFPVDFSENFKFI
jgi:hypothetical protein